MKLTFDKSANGEISVTVTEGTQTVAFSYISLIKSILNKQDVTCEFTDNIEENEKKQILELVVDINNIAKPEDVNTTEAVEQF